VATTAASLSVAVTHSGNFTQGQRHAFNVTVTNAAAAAPTSATVTVTASLGAGMTLVSAAGTGWTCTGLTCTRSDALAAGAGYASIVVTVDVGLNAAATQVVGASVTGGGSAAAQGTDTVTVNAAAGGNASLFGWIALKQGTMSARVWTIGVGNSGSGVAAATQITSVSFLQTSVGHGAACTPAVTAPALPTSLGNIAAGGTTTANVTVNFTGCDRAASFTVVIQMAANSGAATATLRRNDEFR
jgi:hypothetical protein